MGNDKANERGAFFTGKGGNPFFSGKGNQKLKKEKEEWSLPASAFFAHVKIAGGVVTFGDAFRRAIENAPEVGRVAGGPKAKGAAGGSGGPGVSGEQLKEMLKEAMCPLTEAMTQIAKGKNKKTGPDATANKATQLRLERRTNNPRLQHRCAASREIPVCEHHRWTREIPIRRTPG
jgi:hypothetical protein